MRRKQGEMKEVRGMSGNLRNGVAIKMKRRGQVRGNTKSTITAQIWVTM